MNEANSIYGQENSSGYKLSLAIPVNNAVANGSATNTARAILTHSTSGKPVSGKSITFQITAGKAKFTNDKEQCDEETSSEGIAQVDFINATADSAGEMIAVLTDNPIVKSNTAPYSFTVPRYGISLTIPINDSWSNLAQAVVSLNGLPAPSGMLVRFQLNPIVDWQYVQFVPGDRDIVTIGNGYVVVRTRRQRGESIANARIEANQSLRWKLGGVITAALLHYPGTQPQSRKVSFIPAPPS